MINLNEIDQKIQQQAKRINEVEALKEGYFPKESAGHITQVAFADTPKEADTIIFYMKKYIELKEVIQNMIDRLDEGGEMTLTKYSFIVHCLREAIK